MKKPLKLREKEKQEQSACFGEWIVIKYTQKYLEQRGLDRLYCRKKAEIRKYESLLFFIYRKCKLGLDKRTTVW